MFNSNVPILGIRISRLGINQALEACQTRLQTKQGGYVCFANVHTVTESTAKVELKEALNQASFSFADGVPLLWVSRFKKFPIQSRVAGPDFTPRFLSQNQGISHGFIGGKEGQGVQLANRFKLSKVIHYCSPFRDFTPANAKEDWDKFLDHCPGRIPPPVVWIGIGAPKQELWAHTISLLAPQTLFFAVGAAFDFLTDEKKRAPIWMQRSGLEWLFRLFQEPRRLWKRYLVINIRFIRLIIQDLLK